MGQRIRALRKARGWTQQTLAEKAGTRIMTVSSWERDQVERHDPKVLAGLAAALETKESWLAYGDKPGADTALTAPGWAEWCAGSESASATGAERSILVQLGQAAAAEGVGLTPAAYSAALVILRMYGRPATKS